MEGVPAGAGLGPPNPELPPPSHPSSQEPSPYDESEVHDSFHQLIQEQSQWVAEEGLELQQREPGAGGPQTSGEPSRHGARCPDAVGGARSLPCPLQAWGGDGGGDGWPAASPGRPDGSFCFLGCGQHALPGPEDALVHSAATLRVLASMPSRTIGE